MCKSGKTPEKQWKSSVESFVEIIHIFMEHPKSYPQSKIKKFFTKNRPRSINSLSTAFSQVIVKIFVLIHIRSDLFRTVDNGSMVTSS